MIARKGAFIVYIAVSLFLAFVCIIEQGCGGEKPKSNFELGKEYFLASDYPKAMIRLETWVRENPGSPQNNEARAMLAITYHNDETKQQLYQQE